jgi:hypothetical protein
MADTRETPDDPSDERNDSDEDRHRLKLGEIMGIVMGSLGFTATAVGAYFSYRALKNQRICPEDKRTLWLPVDYPHLFFNERWYSRPWPCIWKGFL